MPVHFCQSLRQFRPDRLRQSRSQKEFDRGAQAAPVPHGGGVPHIAGEEDLSSCRRRGLWEKTKLPQIIFTVIAWRLLYATMLSRAMPDAPCTALLEPEEWQALYCAIHRTSTPPSTPPPLRQAVHWTGRLGGFLARRGDGEPGVTVLWKGFQHLSDLTTMYCIMRPPPSNPQNVGKG